MTRNNEPSSTEKLTDPNSAVAILVPSEEGTPPCLSRSPSIVHRVFRRICG